MRDAAGQCADRLELLGLAELRLTLTQRLLDADRSLISSVSTTFAARSSAVRSSSSRRFTVSESIS